ncbi:phage tail-collar fiber domain-containing protein [Pseudomonas quasicaspiana]|uniref:phage tail-collar fiber domain-containing protein n=1 Tax=Pseudomonas quasicaspiana TaxID=2829821 RepID=UPI001E5007B8|nr:phage tail protein [Pseudomonas quasicaspiana]MCD5977211.1 phage tail protein [Pseudomonas quasicaspiana]
MINQNSQFFATLTNVGAAKQANADALGVPWKITHMAIGDANGTDPVPDVKQTKLINELRRAPLNQLKIDPANASVIIAEQVIPADVGGFWIREIGLYDADGDFVAVANCAPSFKPLLVQGSGRTQVVRLNIIVSNAGSVELKVDSSVVLATRAYVDAAILNVLPKNKTAGQFGRVKVNDQGLVVAGDNPETLAGHNIKDAFTKTEIQSMIAQASSLPVGSGVLFPTDEVPPGFLEANGELFQDSLYPDLAACLKKKYNQSNDPAGWTRLPESRGEHLRFWDHGRGVDAGRAVGSWQKGTFHSVGALPTTDSVSDFAAVTGPTAHTELGLDEADLTLYPTARTGNGGGSGGLTLPTRNDMGYGSMRPRNVAFMLCIKAWNAPVNQGNIDIAALAAEVQKYSGLGIVGARKGLRISTTGRSSIVTVVAEQLIVGNEVSTKKLSAVNIAIDASKVGAGGLDTGSLAVSTWYSVWVAWGGAGVTGLLSLSQTVPVLPAGYTLCARVGWVPTDATTANKYPLAMLQVDDVAQYQPKPTSNTLAWPAMSAGSSIGNVMATGGLVAVSTARVIPPTATEVILNLTATGVNGTSALLCPSNNFGQDGSSTLPPLGYDIGTYGEQPPFRMLLEERNVYIGSNASYLLSCIGWRDSL